MATFATASFQIDGRRVTEIARERALCGNLMAALELLGDTPGITLEQAHDVLEGKRRLAGVNEFRLEDEEADIRDSWAEEWLGQVEDVYFDNKVRRYYRVLAVRNINDCGPNDKETKLLEHWARRTLFSGQPYTRFLSQEQKAKLTAQLYFPDEGDIEVRPLRCGPDWYMLYVLELPRHQLVPWVRPKLEQGEPGIPRMLAEGLVVDLRSLEQKYELCPDLKAFCDEDGRPHEGAAVDELAPETVCDATRTSQRDDTALIEQCRAAIIATTDADNEWGWLTVEYEDEGQSKTLRIPHRALLHVAYRRAYRFREVPYFVPPYRIVAPMDFKQADDDGCHTDAWMGTGLPMDWVYDRTKPATQAFDKAIDDLQREHLRLRDLTILHRGSSGRWVTGQAIDPEGLAQADPDRHYLLVLPHAGVEFDTVARKASAIITEVGGKLAHLVTVSRERDIPVVRMDAALQKIVPGQHLVLDLLEGTLEILP